MRRPQPKWMLKLQIGDVLISGSGTERVVRDLSRDKHGNLNCVTFTIRHCSWTGRCYTVLGYTDLNQFGYRPPHKRVRVSMRKKIDRLIDACIQDNNNRTLDCCDVKGIA